MNAWTALGWRTARVGSAVVAATALTYALVMATPGRLAALETGAALPAEALAAARAAAAEAASLLGFLDWLSSAVRGDFGVSLLTGQAVAERLWPALRCTLQLGVPVLVLAYVCAVVLAMVVVHGPQRWWARALSGTFLVVYALPPFWLGLMLLLGLASGVWLEMFPLQGMGETGLDRLWHLVLPGVVLGAPLWARTARLCELALREMWAEPFMLTARAKGLSRSYLWWRHALPNVLPLLAAQLAVDLPWVLGGSVIVERLFALPGLGDLTLRAVLARDLPVLLATSWFAALLCGAAHLVSDALQLWLDPRRRVRSA